MVPSSGRYKVYIIDEVHQLSTRAFNALLKTLEEPPAHAVYILATTEAHKIPATIVSRWPALRLPPGAHGGHRGAAAQDSGEGGARGDRQALFAIARAASGGWGAAPRASSTS
jgi:DNA polymerase-3 subunit gamma/tau